MKKRAVRRNSKRETPRVYVVDLASYNRGKARGAWFDVDETLEDRVMTTLKHPDEIAIHDYEGFAGLTIDEYDSLADVIDKAALIEEHGGAWAAYVNYVGEKYATPDGFEDSYQGEHRSEEEFAAELLDSTGQMSALAEWAQPYFDMERFARDLFTGDYWSAGVPGEPAVYVFSAR